MNFSTPSNVWRGKESGGAGLAGQDAKRLILKSSRANNPDSAEVRRDHMKAVTYNKLVRDRIPEIIAASGSEAKTRVLSEDEFVQALRDKLVEEAQEAAPSTARSDLLNEAADVLEVLYTLINRLGLCLADIESFRQKRALDRGGFQERILLIHTTFSIPEDPSN